MAKAARLYALFECKLTLPACAFLLALPGFFCMLLLPPGTLVADQWAHAYRVSGILNGDLVATHVDSLSLYHSVPGEAVGGRVDDDLTKLSHFLPMLPLLLLMVLDCVEGLRETFAVKPHAD